MGEIFLPLLPVLLLLLGGYGIGTWQERRHIRSLVRREHETSDMVVSNLRSVPDETSVRSAGFVSGSAVIGTDYFKTFAALLRKIVGGEVRTFESLVDRARREATLRMLDEARSLGATEVWNVRYETSNIMSASGRSPAVSVEVYAFGTAVGRNQVS